MLHAIWMRVESVFELHIVRSVWSNMVVFLGVGTGKPGWPLVFAMRRICFEYLDRCAWVLAGHDVRRISAFQSRSAVTLIFLRSVKPVICGPDGHTQVQARCFQQHGAPPCAVDKEHGQHDVRIVALWVLVRTRKSGGWKQAEEEASLLPLCLCLQYEYKVFHHDDETFINISSEA